MCCFVLSAWMIGPRFALALVWIFGERVQHAFASWWWPLVGLLFLPWTTLAYVVVWTPGGLGARWIVVGIGFCLDVAGYSARAAQKQRNRAHA